MLPQHTPLYSIDSNRKGRGPDISPYIRGKIIRATKSRDSPAEIQARFRVSRGAIKGLITQDFARPNRESAHRPGYPRTYTDQDKRMIL